MFGIFRRKTISGYKNWYAPGDVMAKMPGMTKDDIRFYKSKKYKGNRKPK